MIHVNFGIWDNHYLKGPSDGMGLYWGREVTNSLPALAKDVCSELGVGVADLYSVAERNLDKQTDGCHFNGEGYALLADAVVRAIRRQVTHR